ncbi:MAG: transposase [Methanomicrobiales archaeon]|jgi:hypothetical protein|nr:transposase [Methanomicrobiales archaeon]
MIDSPPLEASRYDWYAQYNPHYGCRMYKFHIFHLEEFPVHFTFSPGAAHDSPFSIPLAQKVSRMKPSLKKILMDAGYDSFLNHAEMFGMFWVAPLIEWWENAVCSPDGTEWRINARVNRLWKERASCPT